MFIFTDLLNATIKETDIKGKFCFEIIPAAGGVAKKKNNKEKSYIFQVEKEHERERWVESLRKATAYRSPRPMEMGDENASSSVTTASASGEVAQHSNPMHRETRGQSVTSDGEEEGENENVEAFRSMSSSSFRMTNMIPTEREGYMMKKSPALLKGWQKRYFVTNAGTGDIDYYKSVSSITWLM